MNGQSRERELRTDELEMASGGRTVPLPQPTREVGRKLAHALQGVTDDSV